jgi:hypothetical protein
VVDDDDGDDPTCLLILILPHTPPLHYLIITHLSGVKAPLTSPSPSLHSLIVSALKASISILVKVMTTALPDYFWAVRSFKEERKKKEIPTSVENFIWRGVRVVNILGPCLF